MSVPEINSCQPSRKRKPVGGYHDLRKTELPLSTCSVPVEKSGRQKVARGERMDKGKGTHETGSQQLTLPLTARNTGVRNLDRISRKLLRCEGIGQCALLGEDEIALGVA